MQGNSIFHVDSSFNPRDVPASATRAYTFYLHPVVAEIPTSPIRGLPSTTFPQSLRQHLQKNEDVNAHSLMHSRKKAAPKDSPWLKDIDLDDYPFGRHMLLQVHARSGRGNLYIANHMYHLECRTPRSRDFTPSAEQPFERVPEP
jgi:alpha-ketoglutarate-dependent 2,4-dichlorophenoxyacetate dioxygenase